MAKEMESVWSEDEEMEKVLRNVDLDLEINSSVQVEITNKKIKLIDFNNPLPSTSRDYEVPTAEIDKELKTLKEDYLQEWHTEFLELSSFKERRNIILCVPPNEEMTTMIEIIIMKELLGRKNDVIFISSSDGIYFLEKVREMMAFAVNLNYAVEVYSIGKGIFPPVPKRKDGTVYMTTIEKGNCLLNNLIKANRLLEIGLVVIDELHVIGKKGRKGAIMEGLISKLLFLSGNIQIIARITNLSNIEDLKRFLDAEIFYWNYKPLHLKEYVKINNQIMEYVPSISKCNEEPFRLVRQFNPQDVETVTSNDRDCLAGLILEVIPEGSCLVFCPTNTKSEQTALIVSKGLPKNITTLKADKKMALLYALRDVRYGNACTILQETIPFGVAYYHSNLSRDERRLLEEGYLTGTLCCLTCTASLAPEVNLQSKRVIINTPYNETQLISPNLYKKMIGCQGAAESILIVERDDTNKAFKLMDSKEIRCFSNLLHEDTNHFQNLLLSVIGLKIATNTDDLDKFLNITLLSVQKEIFQIDLMALRKEAVEHLCSKLYIHLFKPIENKEHLSLKQLGMAAFKGNIDTDLAIDVYMNLRKILPELSEENDLYFLYCITPYNRPSGIQPQIKCYYKMYVQFSPYEMYATYLIGLPKTLITSLSAGEEPETLDRQKYERLYSTLIVYHFSRNHSISKASTDFNLDEDVVYKLLRNTIEFATSVCHFCEVIPEFRTCKLIIKDLVQELCQYITPQELLPLMELPFITEKDGRDLYKIGYKTSEDLANAKIDDLMKNMPKTAIEAKQIIMASKMLIAQKINDLQSENEKLLSTLPKPI